MKKCVAVLGGMVLMAAGCGDITGKWSLARVDPSVNRPAFELETLTLQEDGTFYGEARGHGTVSGTYFYDDGNLVLRESAGVTHVYRARFDDAGRELELRDLVDRDVKAVLVKTEENKPVNE